MQLLMSVSYMAVCPTVLYVKTYGIKSFGIEDQVRLIANMNFNLRSLLSAHFLYVKEGFTSMFPSSGKSICVITFCSSLIRLFLSRSIENELETCHICCLLVPSLSYFLPCWLQYPSGPSLWQEGIKM